MIGECGIALLMFTIGVPPPKFDCHYSGALTVLYTESRNVHALCRGSPETHSKIWACAMPQGDRCVIVLPKVEVGVVTQAQQNRLRRHEEGHCNGWLADHAGEIFTSRKRK